MPNREEAFNSSEPLGDALPPPQDHLRIAQHVPRDLIARGPKPGRGIAYDGPDHLRYVPVMPFLPSAQPCAGAYTRAFPFLDARRPIERLHLLPDSFCFRPQSD